MPLHGNDEFAELGREFNDMSDQLEAKIEEVERKRQELEETIRRVGDALATGLDRHGVVALAVRQAVDACEAEAGRALPLARGAFAGCEVGELGGRPEAAPSRRPSATCSRSGRTWARSCSARSRATTGGAHPARRGGARPGRARAVDRAALAGGRPGVPRARSRSPATAQPFTREEEDLLEYLAGQAVVSIENADLHETVERQAVTDELTGLSNVRAFLAILDREIERSRRFEHAARAGDARHRRLQARERHLRPPAGRRGAGAGGGVLRDLSRDLDTPARYGGEEMAVVLPQTDVAGAELLAERMREAIEALQVPRLDGRGTLQRHGELRRGRAAGERAGPGRADRGRRRRALPRKAGGKNRVERAGMPVAEPSSPPR